MPEVPKDEPLHVFCDSAHVVSSKDIILLALRSGGQQDAYMFTPVHAKLLLLALKDQIDKYEAAYAPIVVQLTPGPMVSPVQQKDLDDKK